MLINHNPKQSHFRALPKLAPPSPRFRQVVQLFLEVKNDVLARITKPCNDNYDNDGSDNFCTFNDMVGKQLWVMPERIFFLMGCYP